MQITDNPYRRNGLPGEALAGAPAPSIDAATARRVVDQCLIAGKTPLRQVTGLGAEVWVKDERGRMGMGSFKALGAAYVLAHHALETGSDDLRQALRGRSYITASAGNHGLSLAFGAKRFGARSIVYISQTVPESFAERLRHHGAEVVRAGAQYEESMEAAAKAADDQGWTLLSDSSWPGYFELPHRLMEGYVTLADEAARQMPAPPTHIFLQCGVGGMSAACAAFWRSFWGDGQQIINVEPEVAPALKASIEAGRPVLAPGPVSSMGRLDCKEPSLIALHGLARDADVFATISEEEAAEAMPMLDRLDLATTRSGGAGLAALRQMQLPADARVLCVVSEQADVS
ncbi:MAG: pyridoxal-phosphate dependent enzyme [Pseudomonadota bacterium]